MNINKYVIVFFITIVLFLSAFYLSTYVSNQKLNSIKELQDKVSTGLLSAETRYAILRQSDCEAVDPNSFLSDEIIELGKKLTYLEAQLGANNEQVRELRNYYMTLEGKEYSLIKDFSAKCGHFPTPVLYFYNQVCDDCVKQNYIMDGVFSEKKELYRVFAFDTSLDSPVVHTFVQLYKITKTPTIVVDKEKFEGLTDADTLNAYLVNFEKQKAAADAKLDAARLKAQSRK